MIQLAEVCVFKFKSCCWVTETLGGNCYTVYRIVQKCVNVHAHYQQIANRRTEEIDVTPQTTNQLFPGGGISQRRGLLRPF